MAKTVKIKIIRDLNELSECTSYIAESDADQLNEQFVFEAYPDCVVVPGFAVEGFVLNCVTLEGRVVAILARPENPVLFNLFPKFQIELFGQLKEYLNGKHRLRYETDSGSAVNAFGSLTPLDTPSLKYITGKPGELSWKEAASIFATNLKLPLGDLMVHLNDGSVVAVTHGLSGEMDIQLMDTSRDMYVVCGTTTHAITGESVITFVTLCEKTVEKVTYLTRAELRCPTPGWSPEPSNYKPRHRRDQTPQTMHTNHLFLETLFRG